MGKAEGPLPLLLLRKGATLQEQRLEPARCMVAEGFLHRSHGKTAGWEATVWLVLAGRGISSQCLCCDSFM